MSPLPDDERRSATVALRSAEVTTRSSCASPRRLRALAQPWRVLIVSPVFPPHIEHGGGVAITLEALAGRIVDRGGTVDVLSPATGTLDSYEQTWYPGFRHIFPGVQNMAKIAKAVERADIVVAPDSTLVPFVALMCRVLRTPMLYNVHTDVACLLRDDGAACVARAVDAWFALGSRLATRCLTTSPAYCAEARRRGYRVAGAFSPRIKTSIFELDTDTADEIAAARAWLCGGARDAARRPLLLHVSRLSAEKRIAHCVAAKPRDAILAIVGDGPQRDEVYAMHDDAAGVVVHLGIVPQARLRVLYKAADLVLSASAFETLGMTVMEAHLCGTPTVVERSCASFVAQLVEGAHGNGALADFNDAAAARAAIDAVIARRLSPAAVKRTLVRSGGGDGGDGDAGRGGSAGGRSWDAGLPALDDVVDEVASLTLPPLCSCATLLNVAGVSLALLLWVFQMAVWTLCRVAGTTKMSASKH